MQLQIEHIFLDQNTNHKNYSPLEKTLFFQQTLTCDGNNVYKTIPINRPHEAPIKRLGIKRPELTIIPYVQQVKKK